jgi:cellulose synthase/poly-beta-1,6-N-acetylglucosamine synthase-like glycosyltransferase
MGLGRVLGLFAWVIDRSGVGLAGLAVLFPRLGGGQRIMGLPPHSGSSDLLGVLFLPFSLFQSSLLFLPLSFLLFPLLALRLVLLLFFFVLATFLLLLNKQGLLLASFFMTKNIAERDLVFFVDALCEANATSGGR